MTRNKELALALCAGMFVATTALPAQAALACFGRRATIVGTRGSDRIVGTARGDVIVTFGGADHVKGVAGSDRVCTGGGKDILVGGKGRDFLDGGGGNDKLFGASRRIDDRSGNPSAGDPEDPEILRGGRGTDVIRGGGGNDALLGGPGNDRLYGERNGDRIDGDAGHDLIDTGGIDDRVSYDSALGGPGNDRILSLDKGSDELRGADGDDEIIGSGGGDSIHGGEGDDHIENGIAFFASATAPVVADAVAGTATGQGTDVLVEVKGLVGSPFADALAGTEQPDLLNGNAGDDTLDGRGRDDTIRLGRGIDRVDAGAGDDTIEDTASCDATSCDPFDAPDDTIDGAEGTDMVHYDGPSGVVVDLAADTATGLGSDALVSIEDVTGTQRADRLLGDENANHLVPMGGGDYVDARAGDDVVSDFSSGQEPNELHGGDGDDSISSHANGSVVHGEAGDDLLSGGQNDEELYGGDGNDSLYPNAGHDLVDGGAGSDTVDHTHQQAEVTVDLATGTGTKWVGTDTYVSIENAIGSSYDDVIRGDDAANSLAGGLGSDQIEARGGDDILDGGEGVLGHVDEPENDRLDGGAGNDTCVNGETVTNCEA